MSSMSVRLVTADYYMSPPIPELDVTFSEFRGCHVRQLPILRVFGATPKGRKTCVHIHGVFPYLYIPCVDPKPEPKMAYQIANSIDKALNISLKQAHSNTQHVYKVILVQGIPFYGFHTKPHQFYKIFFYNPVFVKRVADLLQSGAILGLSYQPHEAHINFTMQFFLDFNLYGMSMLNMESVKFRRKTTDDQSIVESLSPEDKDLYLPDTVKYTSCCECEIDCLAQHILNRKDVINGNLGANPGLEALWEDEKMRRKNLNMSETLVPTQSQVRENAPLTESHIHHAKRLLVKLAMNSEMNENSESNLTLSILNDSTNSSLSPLANTHSGDKSINLSGKYVYAAETPMDSQVSIATNVMLHHPSSIRRDKSEDLRDDSSFVDETVVIQCSQNMNISQVVLDSEDMDLMAMLQAMDHGVEEDSILGSQVVEDLEEGAGQYVDDGGIQDDSIVTKDRGNSDAFSSDEDILGSQSSNSNVWNDTFWDNVENISQLDGTWDDPPEDGHKKVKRKLKVGLSKPVRRSARNIIKSPIPVSTPPKVKNDVEVLSMSPKCSSIHKKIEEFQNDFQCTMTSPKKSPMKMRKRLSSLKIFQESPPFRENRSPNKHKSPKRCNNSPNKHRKSTNKHVQLLSPKLKLIKSEEPFVLDNFRLKDNVESLSLNRFNSESVQSVGSGKLNFDINVKSNNCNKKNCDSLNENDCNLKGAEKTDLESVRLNPVVEQCDLGKSNFVESVSNNSSKSISDEFDSSHVEYDETMDESFERMKRTEPLLMEFNTPKKSEYVSSSQYDRENNYFPEAGSSRVHVISSSNESVQSSFDNQINESEIIDTTQEMNESCFNDSTILDTSNRNLGIISFYDKTLYQDKTVVDESEIDLSDTNESQNIILRYETTPEEIRSNVKETDHRKSSSKKTNCKRVPNSNRKSVVLTLNQEAPTRDQVISTLDQYGIPHHRNKQPYYSNPKDVGHQIEVGQIMLKLKSNTIDELKPFKSSIQDLVSLEQWRETIFMRSNMSQIPEIKDLKLFLAGNRKCVLTPAISPPTRKDVMEWVNNKKRKETEKKEVPEEIVPEKIIYCLPSSPGQDLNGSQIDTISLSPFSPLSCTPDSISYSPIPDSTKKDTPILKSTLRKRKLSCKVSRKLRPRSLRLSALQNSQDLADSLHNSSQGSSDSSELIPCGQDIIMEDCLEDDENLPKTLEDAPNNKDESIDQSKEQSPANLSTTLGFKFSGENYQNKLAVHEHEFLTIMVLEILAATRGELTPDPEVDPILAVFYCITNDCPKGHHTPRQESGVIFTKNDQFKADYNETAFSRFEGFNKKHTITVVDDERALFQEVLALIGRCDPDILCGYEVEMFSWGYLAQRGYIIDINMSSEISRVKQDSLKNWKKNSEEIVNKEVKLVGRIMLDVWRLLRHEIALTSYSFENIMYHIMHERVPKFSYKTLYFWWNHPTGLLRSMTMEYYFTRVIGIVNILNHLDLVGRTSELARLFGIQWYEVLSRGSQFRVESMMIRMTRPRNYVLVSPSVQQRAAMKAPECIPLVMEPESRFYNEPVIVLDFQSLYPSMMIAYNYCFSTCLGKVNNMGRDAPFEFGCSQLRVPPKMLERLHKRGLINWSPCGVGFVKREVRNGVLPTMLQDILGTRLMVKKAMKKHRDDKTLQKILHSRQLGLKLIANVTYGYTAANFSGRMPCIEVGDSVVSKGRETLERAIQLVENTARWNAKVVYGDTDSIFVLVPGRSRSEAFDIGAEIAEAVTNDNPTPVKLKLEKVYQPCILQTKKRYVGYMYESKDQTTPTYDAKGIETVRRDGCPATAKMLEKTLRILFETLDVSRVKAYLCKEFQKILEGRCNIKDFVFAKEFRGMNSYKLGAAVPALEVAKAMKSADPRSEPRESERVPYVMVCGAPGEPLMRLARPPLVLIQSPSLHLNYSYYIARQIIPPLNRCLTLLGADVNQWFADLPRKQYQLYPLLDQQGKEADGKKTTISQYFSKVNCPGCGSLTAQGLCEVCMERPQRTMVELHHKVNRWQRRHLLLRKICQSCCGRGVHIDCVSTDCPVLFTRSVAQHHVEQIPFINKMMDKLTSW